MAENKITLGQLITVLTESGIDLNEIYLDENQINSMQTSLNEENQKKLVGFVSELMKSVPEEELSKIGGGKITKEQVTTGLKIGGGILGGVLTLTALLGTCVELLGTFGGEGIETKLAGWKPSDLGKKAWQGIKSLGKKEPTSSGPNTVSV